MDYYIKRYSKYIIGFAYEVFSYEINTYLVINKDKIEYISFKYYDFSSQKRKDEIINILEYEGYKEINYYNILEKKLIL